jgi:DNA-binding CsgD family transcriptional regulator/thioredoxin-like negative regulator of GroEL
LIVADRSRLRPEHPLLGAAARRFSRPSVRRRLHARLAFAANVPSQRVRHLAIATVGADTDLADAAAAAAAAAAERGSAQEAQELAAHSLRLTPPGASEETERVLLLAQCHLATGDFTSVTELLGARVDAMPPGRDRAWAHLLLGEAVDAATEATHLERALVAAGDDPGVRAFALARRAMLTAVHMIERIDQAEGWAREALSLARSAGGDVEARVKPALAWTLIMRGRQVDHLRDAGFEGISGYPLNQGSVERPFAVRLAFRGEIWAARSSFERLLAIAEERGELRSILANNLQLCEVALRAGEVAEASRHLEQLDQWSALEEITIVHRRVSAVLAAVIGSPDETVRWARSLPLEADSTWDRLEVDRALGLAALLSGDFDEAAARLTSVWEHSLREHIDDPGAFPAAGDLVEALVQSGHSTKARRVTETLQLLASEQSHPWGLITAKRSRSMIEMTETFRPAAATPLREAAGEYGRMGLVFEQGRSLLYLGRVERRYKQRSAARASLEEARSIFERAGCSGWAARAEAELSRVSGRRGGDTGLTPSEQRVAELAAGGHSNKEIAGQLFVSVNTVERHLSHAYSKLGVRGRAQLRSHLNVS